MFIKVNFENPSVAQWIFWAAVIATLNVVIGAGLLYGATKIVRFAWMG